jgi:nicotinamidase-related amidase
LEPHPDSRRRNRLTERRNLRVRYSVIDGKNLDFETIVIEDATRPVNLPNAVAETNVALAAASIPRIQSPEIVTA